MKGVVPALTIFAIVLAVMLVLVVGQVVYYMLYRETTVEFFLFDIYVVKNGMNLANLYLENSLDYSVYQAMYDNAMRGGWKDVPTTSQYAENLNCNYNCNLKEEKIGGKLLGCGDGAFGCKEGDENAENHNNQIGKLQCILTNLKDSGGDPYYTSGIDCKFGKGSLEGVKKFQKDKGMNETAVVDTGTVNSLQKEFLLNWDNCGDFFKDCKSRVYSYWQETGGVLKPSEKDLNDSLKSAITENLNEYTDGGYSFFERYYSIPVFKTDQIAINYLDGETEVFANSDETIRFHDVIKHETGEERISIESTPQLGHSYSLDYLKLYEKSSEIFNDLKTLQCINLKKDDKPKDNVKDKNYVINAVVIDKKDTPCEAILQINVTDSSSKFPVSNGANATFESVSMVFLIKIA